MKKKLTKAEEDIMNLFWKYGPSTVSNLLDKLPDPKPAQTTLSSFVRILEKKEFVSHKSYGRTYEYFPLITKEAYSKFSLKTLVQNYFGNSTKELVSFLVKEEDLSLEDIAELLEKNKKQ